MKPVEDWSNGPEVTQERSHKEFGGTRMFSGPHFTSKVKTSTLFPTQTQKLFECFRRGRGPESYIVSQEGIRQNITDDTRFMSYLHLLSLFLPPIVSDFIGLYFTLPAPKVTTVDYHSNIIINEECFDFSLMQGS